MDQSLTIQSWNILHGGGRRLPEIVLALLEHRAHVVVLSEFRRRRGGQLAGILADHGWSHQATCEAAGTQNGMLIASRVPFVSRRRPQAAPPPPCLQARWCEVALEPCRTRLIGLHLPDDSRRDDQRRAWTYLLERARTLADERAVLVGDFNAGRNGIDGGGRRGGRFAASEQMGRLWSLGYIDAWRALHPGEHEASWGGQTRAESPCRRGAPGRPRPPSGVRIDHACVSSPLRPAVLAARFSQAERAMGLSDHAPLLVTLARGDAPVAAARGGERDAEMPKNAAFLPQVPTRQLAGEGKSL